MPRRFQENRRCFRFILGHAVAVEQSDGIFDLGIAMTAGGRGGKPARGFARIFFYAAPFLVERRERVLRFRAAGAGGGAEQLGGAREILRE